MHFGTHPRPVRFTLNPSLTTAVWTGMHSFDPAVTRRAVLTAAGVAGVAAALAACGSAAAGTAQRSPAGGGTTHDPSEPSASGPAGGAALAKLDSIPVGSAVSAQLNGAPVIVARPGQHSAACFSAICTHMGCTVAPAGKQLHCPCHGSVYDATTGKVLSGPAPKRLPRIPVKVEGGEVVPT
jgi:Rieske Fe-S protein